MKNWLLIIALLPLTALAREMPRKSMLRVDFNRMIHDTELKRQELRQEVNNRAEPAKEDTADIAKERALVVDFIDVELSVGESETPRFVDRRFNSVGVAEVVIEN